MCRSASAGYAPCSANSTPSAALPSRPFHPHDESWPLTPGEPVELDIEILPTSIVIPPGYCFMLNVRGEDFDHGLGDRGFTNAPVSDGGTGNLLHDDPQDRPPAIFGGKMKPEKSSTCCCRLSRRRERLGGGEVGEAR